MDEIIGVEGGAFIRLLKPDQDSRKKHVLKTKPFIAVIVFFSFSISTEAMDEVIGVDGEAFIRLSKPDQQPTKKTL